MKVMTLAGDAPGGCLPPWLARLLSCLCSVMIKDYCVYAIVCYWLRAVHSVRFCTLVAMIDATAECVAVGGAYGFSNVRALAHRRALRECTPGGIHLRLL